MSKTSSRCLSAENSAKISNLSFAFILLVVAGHIGWTATDAFGQFVITALVKSLARASVPFYFVVSGFFLAAHFRDEGWWLAALRKRAASLLVPYVFWLTIGAAILLAVTGHWHGNLGGYGFNLCRLPLVGPLWYLRCLMILVILSPLLKRALERWGIWWLAFAYILNLAVAVLTGSGILEFEAGLGGLFGYGISAEGVFYFSLGLYLQDHRRSFASARWPALFLAIGILLVIARFALECRGQPLFVNPCAVMTPFWLVGLWYYTPSVSWPSGLVACTFPIYLLHGIVLSAFWILGCPNDAVCQWVAYAAGVAVPIVVYNILRYVCPVIVSLVFGGR